MTKGDKTALLILGIAGVGAYFFFRDGAQAIPIYARGPVYGTGSGIVTPTPHPGIFEPPAPVADEDGILQNVFRWWNSLGKEKTPNEWRAELLPLIRRQESAYAMPAGLLEAVAEKESAFRHDIITGETLGGAGEEGIMQLKPKYHLSTFEERTNPRIAIPYAAKYLAQNFMRFGNWRDAVAAYNCGPTRLEQGGIAACPAITRSYLAFVESRTGALA